MSAIIIEGPEKAGKSTLSQAICEALFASGVTSNVIRRHQVGRAKPDDRVYGQQLAADLSFPASECIAVWDRAWPSEYVYGTLLGQDRRLAGDPWLGEWLYGRGVMANGLRVMLPGPEPRELARRRSADDLPVDPASEQRLYLAYAFRFGWTVIRPGHTEAMVDSVLHLFRAAVGPAVVLPPLYAGDPLAKVVVVGEDLNAKMTPGGWLPFSSHLTTQLGRLLGDRALDIGWTNAHDCPPPMLRGVETIVACGAVAQSWVKNYVMQKGGVTRLVELPHPAHTFRYNNEQTKVSRQLVKKTIRHIKKEM